MNKEYKHYLQIFLISLDCFLLNVACFISFMFIQYKIEIIDTNIYILQCIKLNIIWILLFSMLGTYSENIIKNFESFTKRTVQSYFIWIITILFYTLLYQTNNTNKIFTTYVIFIFVVGIIINRFLYFGITNYLKINHDTANNVIILGYNETAKKLASYFEEEGININLIGFTEDEKNMTELTHYPILSNINDTIKTAKENDVQEIFSTITPEQNNYVYTLMKEAENQCLRFKVVPNLSTFFSKPVVIDYIRDMPILSLRADPLEDIGNKLKKRILDLFISSFVAIFILWWMIPLLGLLIKLESKGPVFFKQLRTGINDKSFYCLKFRSMKMNNDADSKQATKNDARITKIGAFLRRTSLDEFPQFINVLRGEMSIVGPRPHMVKHTSEYAKIVDQYMIRQLLKPGITGWAQVHSLRGEITNPEQIKMRVASDLWYLENWNIWLDIRIVFLTIYHVFNGDKNAY